MVRVPARRHGRFAYHERNSCAMAVVPGVEPKNSNGHADLRANDPLPNSSHDTGRCAIGRPEAVVHVRLFAQPLTGNFGLREAAFSQPRETTNTKPGRRFFFHECVLSEQQEHAMTATVVVIICLAVIFGALFPGRKKTQWDKPRQREEPKPRDSDREPEDSL